MKKIAVLGIALIVSGISFAQENPFLKPFSWNHPAEKIEFVYKRVEGHEIKANVFLPETKGLHPVLIYFHGGGFIFGNRDKGLHEGLRDKLLESGYAVISADYRLVPETKLDQIMSDVLDMLDWVRKNGLEQFNINTNQIAVAGGSAGGYLALASGFKKETAPNAIIDISAPTGFASEDIEMGDLSVLKQAGPYDIVKDSIVSYGDYDTRMQLCRFLIKNNLAVCLTFGFDPAKEPGKLKKYTLTDNIKADYPPTLILHAKNDRAVGFKQVEDFYKFMKETNVKTELYVVENGHSNELLRLNTQAIDKIIEFLKQELR
ncbi:alpha/beta hydrolase [Marinifilum sp. D737]|uniref:alpha/beta hydrolase n=1 Tax=Marinifilum sp. D737 TaxID=2969628 RepID=UPI002274C587|nr:alpha/beta hydrolase [Marinifilum sp. D737]MCY1635494.1 alpha/beta hydrolase [Marinifilum sp. D737]